MRTLSRTVLIATLALAASACGSSAPTRVGTTSVPTGADEVVFRIDSRGGLTGVEYQLGIVPGLTVYGDGRVIVTGPVPEIYPPAALPNLMTGTLSPDEGMARCMSFACCSNARSSRASHRFWPRSIMWTRCVRMPLNRHGRTW